MLWGRRPGKTEARKHLSTKNTKLKYFAKYQIKTHKTLRYVSGPYIRTLYIILPPGVLDVQGHKLYLVPLLYGTTMFLSIASTLSLFFFFPPCSSLSSSQFSSYLSHSIIHFVSCNSGHKFRYYPEIAIFTASVPRPIQS